jgi:hypothetical protein
LATKPKLLNYKNVRAQLLLSVDHIVGLAPGVKRDQWVRESICRNIGQCHLCGAPYALDHGVDSGEPRSRCPIELHHMHRKRRSHTYDLGSLRVPTHGDAGRMVTWVEILCSRLRGHVLVCGVGSSCHRSLHNQFGAHEDLSFTVNEKIKKVSKLSSTSIEIICIYITQHFLSYVGVLEAATFACQQCRNSLRHRCG